MPDMNNGTAMLTPNYLGSFTMASKIARITDPCYERPTWCAATLENVRQGTWHAETLLHEGGDWGIRNAYLVVYHDDLQWQEHSYDLGTMNRVASDQIGVDSGRAGFFDDAYYIPDESLADEMVQAHGVFCESGYGDGCYICTVYEEDGEIIAAAIQFIHDLQAT